MQQPSIWNRLIKLSLPVMFSLLIQSIYNIADSYFVARYSSDGLAALSLIYPIQLFMTALATGTGSGLGLLVSHMDGQKAGGSSEMIREKHSLIASGLFLGIFNYLIFTLTAMWGICGYFSISSSQQAVRESGLQYAHIVFLFSFGLFAEANATKLLQAKGNTVLPMLAQIAGAVLNILLDPILIYGLFGLPAMGIRGAAVATVLGQWLAMFIVILPVFRRFPVFSGRVLPADCIRIYRAGLPAIAMQSLNTLYIVGLNLVLKQFSESAVLVLGIYYKLQTFFFIPLMGLQQVILPLISFYHGAEQPQRERQGAWLIHKTLPGCHAHRPGCIYDRPRRPSFHLHSRTGCPLHRLHRASDHLPQFPVRRPGNDVYRIFSERRARENQPAGDCASPGRSPGPPGLAVPL